jgi:hypothetical protein
MCDKCKKLDFQIARCEDLRLRTEEPLFVEGLEALIESYRHERSALHAGEAAIRNETA